MESVTPRERLAALDGRPGIAPDVLDLEERLMSWRESVRASLTGYPQEAPPPSDLEAAIRDGRCLTDVCAPLPEKKMLAQACRGLLDAVGDSVPGAARVLERVREILEAGDRDDELGALFLHGWQGTLATRGLWAGIGDGEAGDAGAEDVAAEAVTWFGRQLARPFFHQLGSSLSGQDAFARRDPRTLGCPCCGGIPRMGRYGREEGQRYLWCDLCDVQWRFARLTCPFCGTTKQEELGYLSFEDLDPYRVDVCEACHGYVRAKNERDLPEGVRVDFTIEDVGTLHLSLVAEKAGYHPAARRHEDDGPEPGAR